VGVKAYTKGPRYHTEREDRLKEGEWQYRPNDAAIIKYLARYRYLRGKSIQALLAAISGAPVPSVNYSLKKLRRAGLIRKPKAQNKAYNTLNDTDIYELTEYGYEFLHTAQPEATNLTRTTVAGYDCQFRHAMMICDGLSNIELGTLLSPGYTFIPQDEILAKALVPNPLRLPCSIKYTFKDGHTETLSNTHAVPDGVFGIRMPDGRTFLFLLEANFYTTRWRNELGQSSLLKKLLCYQNIKETKAVRTNLGKSAFNVLFLFPNFRLKRENTGQMSRIENAVETVVELFGKNDLFLMQKVALQEEQWTYPHPYPELFTGEWQRGGMDPIRIADIPK
jgi:DNA-binding transcriptional ArsR family regulator